MKNTLLKLLNNGIIAACENEDEAIICQNAGASAILLVNHRGDVEGESILPNTDIITVCKEILNIPLLVRIRHGHYGEAEMAESLGANGIVEGFKTNESLDESLNHEMIGIPVINEIYSELDLKGKKKLIGENTLILGDFASGNIAGLDEKIKKLKSILIGEPFIGGGINSPADLSLLKTKGVKGYFIGTALFVYSTDGFLQSAIGIVR